MKRLLLAFLLTVSCVIAEAQAGFINLNDFGPPTYPYPFSRFWLRGSTPAGSNPIIEVYGLNKFVLFTDTIKFNDLYGFNDATPTRLISIGSDSILRSFPYVTPVNADWNSGSGLSQILNKPAFATVATSGDYNDLSNKPTIPAVQVNSDWNSSSGLSEILNKPPLKRIETYLGTTDGSGNYTVTYGTPFSVTPDVQPQLQSGLVTQSVRITASSTTGFTVNVTNRAVVSLLGIDLVSGTATVVSGSSVGVLVTSR